MNIIFLQKYLPETMTAFFSTFPHFLQISDFRENIKMDKWEGVTKGIRYLAAKEIEQGKALWEKKEGRKKEKKGRKEVSG